VHSRVLIATALYTGLRISELLGLIWDDVDLRAGMLHVRAQLSRARGGARARPTHRQHQRRARRHATPGDG